jgi:hypothetical protein
VHEYWNALRCHPQTERVGCPLRRAVITWWDPVNGVGAARVLHIDTEAWFHSSVIDAADLKELRAGVVVFGEFEDVAQDGYSQRARSIKLDGSETPGRQLHVSDVDAGYNSDLQLSLDEDA